MRRRKMRGLCGLLSFVMLVVSAPINAAAAWANPFTDVKPSAWYYDAVEYVNTNDLFSGTAADQFSPGMPMSRGMFVTVLGKFHGVNTSEYPTISFTDVKGSDYYAPYVEWAAENDIVSGVGGGQFAPNSSITREQMATIFYKYAQFVGADTTFNSTKLLNFPDGTKVSEYAQQAMAWAVTHGVLAGSEGKLLPQGTATRAQTAQIFYNAHELLATQVEQPSDGEGPGEETPTPEEPSDQSFWEKLWESILSTTQPPADAEWLPAVRRELEGGTHTLSEFGVTREALVAELTAHEYDTFYQGTPYIGGDYQSPNGDTSYNGKPGMNCGGFVSYVLRKAGLRAEEVMQVMKRVPGQTFTFGSGKKYDVLAGASNYRNLVKNAHLEAYVFSNELSLLASGKAEKGDIIFIDKGPNAKPGEDTHIGFYWGTGHTNDMWHSGQPSNTISLITAATTDPVYILIKID